MLVPVDDVVQAIESWGVAYSAGPLMADRWGPEEHALVLTATSRDGAQGRAMVRCHLGTSYQTIQEWVSGPVAQRVLGCEVSVDGLSQVWEALQRLYRCQYLPLWPLSAVDIALWDLVGVKAETPVRKLLSGTAHDEVAAYSSIPRYRDVPAGVRDAVATHEAGYKGIKVHTCGDVAVDLELLRAIAREFGSDGSVMYDGSKLMSEEDAARVARVLEEIGGLWLEEPFDPFDDGAHERLTSAMSVPIIGFETAPGGPESSLWAVRHGHLDGVLADCNWKGGMTGAVRTADLVFGAGSRVVMHHGGSSTMNLANMHFVAAQPEIPMVELLTPVDSYNHGQSIPRPDQTGKVALNHAPGFGQEWDDEWLIDHEIAGSRQRRTVETVGEHGRLRDL